MFQPQRQLRVAHYSIERIRDPRREARELGWQEYHAARNSLVHACRSHGPTGPLLERRLGVAEDAPIGDAWVPGDEDPTYFIVDDQYNDERYLYMYVLKPEGVTAAWLGDVAQTLGGLPRWGVCLLGIHDGYIIVFENMLLVAGQTFAGCTLAAEVLEALRRNLHVSS